ncbi:MAG: zinc-ribbon domain-containing protein [Eggerthellaceae bacterium]|nr:zinc-ribbon domain-containing protein [Eggerthellaceae bacterium]
MDQERNMFDSQGWEAMQERAVDGTAVDEIIEDEEAQAIVVEAEREKAQIESELADVERRLDLEYTMLGKRAFEFAQTDSELASRLGVALAAVTAQTERKVRLSRSLETMEKKTADRLADLKRAREAQESARASEEDLARKEEAAREAMERARLLEQEAEQARHVRESAQHEADAAALAASRTMLISFTDDAPMASEGLEAPASPIVPEEPVMPEAPELPEMPETAASVQDAQSQEAPVADGEFVSDLSPALQAMFGPVSFPEPEAEFHEEPAASEDSDSREETDLPEEPEPALEPEPDAQTYGELELDAEVNEEPAPEAEEDFEAAADSVVESEPELEAAQSWGFTPVPAVASQPEPERDPNATLLLSDYDDQPAETGFAAQPVNPEATLLLDDEVDIPDEQGATCPVCGFSVQEGDKFCLQCGSKLESPVPEQDTGLGVQPEVASEAQPEAASHAQPDVQPEAAVEAASHPDYPVSVGLSDAALTGREPQHAPAHARDAIGVSEPPAPAAPSVRCCACGAEIQLGDRFCLRCGARQDQPVAAPIAPAPVASAPICTNCGLELNPGDKFCMRCGTPVQQVPTSQAPQVPVARLCPHCGAEYSETDKFCMMCGTPL